LLGVVGRQGNYWGLCLGFDHILLDEFGLIANFALVKAQPVSQSNKFWVAMKPSNVKRIIADKVVGTKGSTDPTQTATTRSFKHGRTHLFGHSKRHGKVAYIATNHVFQFSFGVYNLCVQLGLGVNQMEVNMIGCVQTDLDARVRSSNKLLGGIDR